MKLKPGKESVTIGEDGHISAKVPKNKKRVAVPTKTHRPIPVGEYDRVEMGEDVVVYEPEEEGFRKESEGKGRRSR